MTVKMDKLRPIWSSLVLLFFLTLLSGGFSLGRIFPDMDEASLWLQPRVWFACFWAVLVTGKIFIQKDQTLFSGPKRAILWLLSACVLFTYLCLTYFWASNPEASMKIVIDIVLMAVSLAIVPAFFSENPVGAFIVISKAMYAAALVYAIVGILTYSESRIAVFGGGPNVYSRVMFSGILAGIFLWLRSKKIMWVIPVPLFLICGILSGSRGGLFSFLLVLPFCFLFFSARQLSRLVVGCFFIAGVAFIVFKFSPFGRTIADYWNNRFVQLTFVDHYGSGREDRYAAALESFKAAPWLGVGVGNAVSGRFEAGNYSHNIFLDILADGGIVGIGVFVFTLCILSLSLWGTSTLPAAMAALSGGYYFFASQFSGTYYDTRFMWVFFCLALLMRRSVGNSKPRPV